MWAGAICDIASLVISLMTAESRIIILLLTCISCRREAELAEVEASGSTARSQKLLKIIGIHSGSCIK